MYPGASFDRRHRHQHRRHRLRRRMMKVCINFGDIRCVVPVGDGSLAVKDVIDLAVERFRKATSKVSPFQTENSLLFWEVSESTRAQFVSLFACGRIHCHLTISSLRKHDHLMLVRHTIFISVRKCVLYRTLSSVSVNMFCQHLFVRLLQAPTEVCFSLVCLCYQHAFSVSLTVRQKDDEL